VWAAFWGWDCCGPGGLLERVYLSIGIPRRSWPGLVVLPEVWTTSIAQTTDPWVLRISC
jgi:hypothetical protein